MFAHTLAVPESAEELLGKVADSTSRMRLGGNLLSRGFARECA